jgi:hypothetical protein
VYGSISKAMGSQQAVREEVAEETAEVAEVAGEAAGEDGVVLQEGVVLLLLVVVEEAMEAMAVARDRRLLPRLQRILMTISTLHLLQHLVVAHVNQCPHQLYIQPPLLR